MKKFLVILSILPLLVTGCFVDTGNYSYSNVDGIEISDINDSYNDIISFQDVLSIKPTVKTSYPESELTFKWIIYDAGQFTDTTHTKIISTDKNLNFPANIKPGTSKITFHVSHKNTGLTSYKTFTIQCKTKFSRGMYFIKETIDGKTEVDAYVDESTKFENLLVKSLGASMSNKPTRLSLLVNYCFIDPSTKNKSFANCIGTSSGNEFWIIRVEDMKLIYDHNTMFYASTFVEKPLYALRGSFYTFFLSDKGVYSVATTPEYSSISSGLFGLPKTPYGCDQNIIFSRASNGPFYFNDQQRCFMSADTYGNVHTYKDVLANNIDGKCIFIGHNFTSSLGEFIYSIIEKANGSRVLYSMKPASGSYNTLVTSAITLPESLNINKATEITSNKNNARMLYYIANNKVYAYNIDNGIETDITPVSIGSNETLNYIQHKFWSGNVTTAFNHLFIGSNIGNNYTVRMYNLLGGAIDGGVIKSFTGTGKIREMQYVSPDMKGPSLADNYSY